MLRDRLGMPAPFAHSREIVHRFFRRPKASQEFVRITRKDNVLFRDEFLKYWMSLANIFLGSCQRQNKFSLQTPTHSKFEC
jgi:hypothetical protein